MLEIGVNILASWSFSSVLWVWSFQSRYSHSTKENPVHEAKDKERAPSTAEEFKKIAEEKIREGQISDSEFESVKRRSDEQEKGSDYGRRADHEPEGAKAFSDKS